MFRLGGIHQRAQKIEDRGNAQRRAGGGDEFHGGMMVPGEGEADVGFGQASAEMLGRQFQVQAEFFQDVGGAGLAGSAAVAVLGDLHAGGGDDQGGGSRDVKCSANVAAGAAGVDDDLLR